VKRIARSLAVAVFFVVFVTGEATPGCSCNTPKPAPRQVVSLPVNTSLTSVKRESPPPTAPGERAPKVELMVLNDKDAGIVFYFETDGRHVTALRRDGSVIWHRDIVQATARISITPDKRGRVITFAGPAPSETVERLRQAGKDGPYILVGFNEAEMGLVNKMTGEYLTQRND
jgi:hypothetical protein